MTHSRLLMRGLGLVLVLITGGVVIMSAPGRLLAVDAAQSPSGVTPETSNSSNNSSSTEPAQVNQPPQTGAGATNANPSTNQEANLYCPKQTELYKKDQFWYGPNSWRDYSPSFADHVSNFAGAQWVGVNVGKIICLYKGLEVNDFPIALERDNLMKKPDGEHWKADPSGYQICKSDNISDCPFSPQEDKANQNIYDFLKDIKKK